jgi:hypothetical protein
MRDGQRRVDGMEAREGHGRPSGLRRAPVARGLPALGLGRDPAIREPEFGTGVAAIGQECEPLRVRHQRPVDTSALDQHLVAGRFVVERETLALMPDPGDTPGEVRVSRRPRGCGKAPGRIVGWAERVLREGVQDVGDQQFLVLLLVIEPDLEHGQDRLEGTGRRLAQQRIDGAVHMRAIGRDLVGGRAGDQPAQDARLTRAGGDVVRVEQVVQPLVVNGVAGQVLAQQELLEEPGRVGAMPLSRAGIGH